MTKDGHALEQFFLTIGQTVSKQFIHSLWPFRIGGLYVVTNDCLSVRSFIIPFQGNFIEVVKPFRLPFHFVSSDRS